MDNNASIDMNHDSLSNQQEFLATTDPRNLDTNPGRQTNGDPNEADNDDISINCITVKEQNISSKDWERIIFSGHMG